MNKTSILLFVIALLFDACCNEDFITPSGDYDFIAGAIDVTDLIENGECSFNEEYTTVGATADGEAAECGGPTNNRWFKFRATSTGEIWMSVQVGGSYGTQTETVVHLWGTDATTYLYCEAYITPDASVYLDYTGLTPGEVYYLSVDCTSDTVGTFSLCLSDID